MKNTFKIINTFQKKSHFSHVNESCLARDIPEGHLHVFMWHTHIYTWMWYTHIYTWMWYTYIYTWMWHTHIYTWMWYTHIYTWMWHTHIYTWMWYTHIYTWMWYTHITTWIYAHEGPWTATPYPNCLGLQDFHVCDCDTHTYTCVWHDSFIAWDMTPFLVWMIHLLLWIQRLSRVCDMIHSHVRHDAFSCVNDSFIALTFTCVTWFIHTWDMTHFHVWMIHLLLWIQNTFQMSHVSCVNVWHDSFMWDMTHSCGTWFLHVGYDSFVSNESCLMCQWIMSHMNESCPTWMSHVPHEWIMSHIHTWDMTHLKRVLNPKQ